MEIFIKIQNWLWDKEIKMINNFVNEWEKLEEDAEQIANKHGFFHENDAEALMLMVSELSEGLEYLREGDKQSNHIPEFKGIEEEFADVVIRILHYSKTRSLKVGWAIIEKMKYNKTRSYKHGGKKF